MANVISVVLTANTGSFKAAMASAAASAKSFGAAVESSSDRSAKTAAKARDTVSKVALGIGVGLVAGFGVAAGAAMRFDQQMSATGAAATATGSQLNALREQALQMGADTAFSATEAAQAQEELAKAGLSTSEILGGALPAALTLAASNSLDLATASTYMADTLTQFNLSAGDSAHVADVLAAAAGKSSTDVDGLSQAMNQSALVANQMGVGLEETAGTLALFASQGLKGSDAGTSLKTALQRLVNPIGQAQETMNELGIDVFDTQGNFIGLAGTAEELRGALSGMTVEQRNAALAQIGGADAVRSLSILYEAGASGVNDWTEKVDDTGYASEQAAARMDNLAGDLETLGGALETALIQGGSKATGALRFMTQGATGAVNAFSGLPGPVQTAAIAFAGIAGGMLTVGGAAATFGPKIRAAMAALEAMGPAGAAGAKGLGMLGKAIVPLTVGVVAIQGLNFALEELFGTARSGEELERLARQLDTFGSATERAQQIMLRGSFGEEMDDLAGAMRRVTAPGTLERVQDVGVTLTTFGGLISDAGTDLSDAHQDIDDFNEALTSLAESDPTAAGQAYAQVLRTLISEGVPAREAMEQLKDAREAVFAGGLPAGAEGTADAIETVGDAADRAQDRVTDFQNALTTLFFGVLDIPAAADAVAQSINDLSAQMIESGGAIRGNSDEALANRDALRGVLSAQLDYINALKESGAPQQALTDATNASVMQLQGLAQQFPQLAPIINGYISQLQAIPAEVETTVAATDTTGPVVSQARARLDAWNNSRGIATVDADNENARVRLTAARDSLHSWDTSTGTSTVAADNHPAHGMILDAEEHLAQWDAASGTAGVNANPVQAHAALNQTFARLLGWDGSTGTADAFLADHASSPLGRVTGLLLGWNRNSGTADANLNDNASGPLGRIAGLLNSYDGRSVTATINVVRREIGGPAGSLIEQQLKRRWGGVHEVHGDRIDFAAQTGMAWQAHIARQPTILYGERATGGEAMVPRFGNYAKSMGILNHAAGWYGATVQPAGALTTVGRPSAPQVVDNSVTVQLRSTIDMHTGDVLDGGQLAKKVRSVVQLEQQEFARTLQRQLKTRRS